MLAVVSTVAEVVLGVVVDESVVDELLSVVVAVVSVVAVESDEGVVVAVVVVALGSYTTTLRSAEPVVPFWSVAL